VRADRVITTAAACAAFLAVALAHGAVLVPTNVNVSKRQGNEDESAIAVNPTNTSQVVAISNLDTVNSIFKAYSSTSGATWTTGTLATGVACCDGQMAWDSFGNLFVVYINNSVNQINLLWSTDGGVTFTSPFTLGTGSIDQPSVAVGAGSVWVDWNLSGSMVARGAAVTGLGTVGAFGAQQAIPSATGSFGDIAVGPSGQVTVTYQSPTGGQGPATIYANTDADGLGAGGFGARVTVTTTNVGGFDFIPAQSARSIDAEAGLAYDRTGGAHNGRLYLVYTEETVNENNDTEIYVRTSDNSGATWTAPVRVNDDPVGPIRSQFLPHISVDPTTGRIAATWHDARNDGGVVGSGSTNAIPNDDAMYYGSVSSNGGATWGPNFQISAGVSNAAAAAAPVDYGDYAWSDYSGGHLHPIWSDNSNSTGDNPDGKLHAFDLYTADIVSVPTAVQVLGFRAAHEPAGVVLRWSVPAGSWSAGFNVYRSTARGWAKVNDRLIPARSAQLAQSYQFVDRSVVSGRYRLELVGVDGTRVWRAVTRTG
jgi:hypothetical protein